MMETLLQPFLVEFYDERTLDPIGRAIYSEDSMYRLLYADPPVWEGIGVRIIGLDDAR